MTDALAGVVLCGGAGRRWGANKARLAIDGRLVVLQVAERLASIADPVLIAAGEQDLPELPFELIPDDRPDAGPLSGIVAALRATDRSGLVVVAGDMPHASPAVVALLASLRNLEDAVVPVDDYGPQPLHALYARSALGPFEAALDTGEFSMRRALERLQVREVTRDEWGEADPSGRFAFNVNHPNDVRELR